MADYTFDSTTLKRGTTTIAHVKDNQIRQGNGTKVLGHIHGEAIREGTGTKTLFTRKGDEIRAGTGTSKIATMKDVDAAIKGPGKTIKAALWLLCCR